ncbi:MAG: hypothetical protein ACKOW8_06230, partial [Flavobacteriales bacterium]
MLNRRHIRIKALQVIFAYYNEEKPDMVRYEKMLFESFQRFRDLYISLLFSPVTFKQKSCRMTRCISCFSISVLSDYWGSGNMD